MILRREKDLFRTLSNIYDPDFLENSYWFFSRFHKKSFMVNISMVNAPMSCLHNISSSTKKTNKKKLGIGIQQNDLTDQLKDEMRGLIKIILS